MKYHLEAKDISKMKITRLFYGGNPDNDVPHMWKLKEEVDDAAEEILNLPQNSNL